MRTNRKIAVLAKLTSSRISISTSGHHISHSNSPYIIYFAVSAFTEGTGSSILHTCHIWRNTKYECKRPWFLLVPVLTAYVSINFKDDHFGKWVIATYQTSNALSLSNSAQINYINTPFLFIMNPWIGQYFPFNKAYLKPSEESSTITV